MTMQEIIPTLEDAGSVRELLTDEVKAAYREETSAEERELIRIDLRRIAKDKKFLKDFDSAFSAFKKTVDQEEKALLEQEKQDRREAWAAENKIDLYDNPYPYLHSRVYVINHGGVFLGNEQICTQPVLVFGKMKNVETDEEAICVAYLSHGKWLTQIAKREVLFSSSQIIKLSAYGLNVHSENARRFVKFLDAFMEENQLALVPKMSISRLGWLPDGRFSPYDEDIVFDGEFENRPLYQAVSTAGSAERWVSYVRKLRKNMELRLTMAASFAGPLIKLTGSLPFIFNLWGGSGTHKTVALMVAMSVWGDPSIGNLVQTVNATRNYMLNTATFFFSVPVAYDELQIAKFSFSSVDALVMFLTEPTDRGRMKYNNVQRPKEWACDFLFTGESPILKPTSDAGIFNRVIECETKGPLTPNGNEAANIMKANYGHAGKIFIEHIKARWGNIEGLFRECNTAVLEGTGATDKQAASAALMLLGDKLAGECLFPGEPPLTVEDIKPYLKTQSTVDISKRAYEYICGQIAVNRPKFLTDNQDSSQRTGEIWGKISNGICTINKVKLDELLDGGGFSFDAVKKSWASKGHSLKNSQNKYAVQTSVAGTKAYYVEIIIDPEEWKRDQDDEGLPL